MENNKYMNDICIENAKIFKKNFDGLKHSQFDKEGERYVNIVIDSPVIANQLREVGWNVKQLPPREENAEPLDFIKAKINYAFNPPRIWAVTPTRKTLLDDSTLSSLQNAYIKNVDVVLHPYKSPTYGTVTAYVAEMYANIEESVGYFDNKYANIPG